MANNPDYFGSLGCGNPEVFKPGLIALRRTIDFAIAPIGEETGGMNHEFLALPAGLIVTGMLIKEVEQCSSGTLTISEVGSNFRAIETVVGGNTLSRTWEDFSADLYEGGMVAISSATKIETGKVEFTVIGYLPDGDSLDNKVLEVPYKNTLQTVDNVSGGDLYLAIMKQKKIDAAAPDESGAGT